MAVSINGTNGVTFNDGTAVGTAASLGVRNKIINGAMEIDQRNAGASVTVNNTVGGYGLDRWYYENNSGSGVFTVQRVADAPSGFLNSLKITTTTADATLNATDRALIAQKIEGYNTIDLAFGSASAKTITISFWCKSSLTGTFGGVVCNNAGNRSYPFTYSVSSASTWEYKTITVTGDTTGTWLTDNSAGVIVIWGLGVGSTYSGTAGSWAASQYLSATGGVNVIGTNSATWQITGVQLEVGSVATPFERRLYNQELAMCQRYYYKYTVSGNRFGYPINTVDSYRRIVVFYKTSMRGTPTCTVTASVAGGSFTTNQPLVEAADTETAACNMDVSASGAYANITSFTASAEL
jgi:hypothetical protein